MPSRLTDLARRLFRRPNSIRRAPMPPLLRVESLEDRMVPAVIVSVTTVADATESGEAGRIRFYREDADLSAPVTVAYTVGGTATAGSDYTALPETITFDTDVGVVDVPVAAVPGHTIEGDQSIEVTVADGGETYSVGTSGSAAVMIVDDVPDTSAHVYRETLPLSEDPSSPLVTLNVTSDDPEAGGTYTWQYAIENPSSSSTTLTEFNVHFDAGDVTDLQSDAGWAGTSDSDGVSWTAGEGVGLQPGQSVVFSFTSAARTVATGAAEFANASTVVNGQVPAPGPAVPAAPNKTTVTSALNQELYTQIQGFPEPKKTQSIQQLQNAFGVDITNQAEVDATKNNNGMFNVRDVNGSLTSSFGSQVRFSGDFAGLTVPAGFIQTVQLWGRFYDGVNVNPIVQEKTWVIEGFKADANGKSVVLDSHSFKNMPWPPGAKKLYLTADFEVGIGQYDGKAPAKDFEEYLRRVNQPWTKAEYDKIKWMGPTVKYKVDIEVSADGSWEWIDTGATINVSGTYNTINKDKK